MDVDGGESPAGVDSKGPLDHDAIVDTPDEHEAADQDDKRSILSLLDGWPGGESPADDEFPIMKLVKDDVMVLHVNAGGKEVTEKLVAVRTHPVPGGWNMWEPSAKARVALGMSEMSRRNTKAQVARRGPCKASTSSRKSRDRSKWYSKHRFWKIYNAAIKQARRNRHRGRVGRAAWHVLTNVNGV